MIEVVARQMVGICSRVSFGGNRVDLISWLIDDVVEKKKKMYVVILWLRMSWSWPLIIVVQGAVRLGNYICRPDRWMFQLEYLVG